MSCYPLCGSYFRPWSPGDENPARIPCSHSMEKDSSVLDLSKKHTDPKTQSPGNLNLPKSSTETPISKYASIEATSTKLTPSHGNKNAFCIPNPFLLQQLQAYYNLHLMRSHPALHTPHRLTEEIIQWQKQAMLVPQPVAFPNKSSNRVAGVSPGTTLNIDTAHDAAFIQRRGILNVPSPSFSSHSHSPLTEDSWENKYPLPSAKDGEPLDLLPKSLYMNKAHGGHLCIFCGKLYSRKYGLKIHLRTHTGYKPLKCKVCQRPFGDPSNLNKHIRLHAEGETPYRCDKCGKVLVRRRDLERHIRSRHPSEAEKMTHIDSPVSSDDGLNSSYEAESIEELDVVGLHQ